MPALDDLKAFDIEHAELSLWVFRRTLVKGKDPTFRGKWVETSNKLDEAIKYTVSAERAAVEEVEEYGLLAQNNEGSALSITLMETHAGLLVEQASAETTDKKVKKLQQLNNIPFYAIKLALSERIMFAVSRAGISWRTKKEMMVFFPAISWIWIVRGGSRNLNRCDEWSFCLTAAKMAAEWERR